MFEGIEIFSSLGEKALKTLEMFCQERIIRSGEIIFEKGDESNSMYIVKTGILQAFDNDNVLGNINPGEIVGEMSIFGEPKFRTASVKAIKDSKIIVLLSFSIKQLGEKYPEILEQIEKIIKQRKKKNR